MLEFKSKKIKHLDADRYSVDVGGEIVKVEITPELIKNLKGLDVAKTDEDLEKYILEAAIKFNKLIKSKSKNAGKAWDDLI